MCGRYNLNDSPLVQTLMTDLGIDIEPLPARYNIAPTEQVLAIYRNGDAIANCDTGNALAVDALLVLRAIDQIRDVQRQGGRTYQKPFRRQRAVLPASSFIESQKHANGKQAYEIKPADGLLLFTAVWDCWYDCENNNAALHSCSIVTTEAVPGFRDIHARQPVILKTTEVDA